MSIPLADGRKIELQNMALALEYDSNLISIGQFRETGITYYDNLIAMILMKNRKVIAYIKKNRNLFTMELVQPEKAMATMKTVSIWLRAITMTEQGRSIYYVS